ncbi:gluconokinase [Sporolactobacillus inulinus]|uniref:Gluconokinase n=1 Tax=Sporolactobacillus inulinus CASD TaxID=1069536 RepID=A0A0U1QN84_9BACL|nr:gluconokinase [Sporolactobacillus inulinus]KLI02268.1 gluconokinase [Sporolactobacillus inulinus CASD]GEB77401.1 gluconate kinase [Sporolactobacillus inulinus]
MSDYMIGADIGTTSTKAVLYKTDGTIVAYSNMGYPLYTPDAFTAEQDPEEIFTAVLSAIREVVAKGGVSPQSIAFVSFSCAMHSLVPVDAEGKPLMRCMTWADNRSIEWCDKIKKTMGGHDIYMKTGTPIHPMSPLPKLVWMKNERPELFNQTKKFISIKEYIFYKLFHTYVVDYSIASSTGLFAMKTLTWDKDALAVAGITEANLSELVPTTHQMVGMDPVYAEQMGLNESTPFVLGASDGVLSNLGVNAIDPGVVAVTIGTSGAIRTVADKPSADPKERLFCYVLTEDKWVIGGPVNNGGGVLRWARDEFAAAEVETAKRLGISPYEVLTRMAARVKAGSDGLIFQPYFSGERAPLWNPNARGAFFGLTLHHQKQHMIRAVLEGIIYNLYSVMLAMRERTGEPKKIQATGGFARSELWRQMMADIFAQPVNVPESFESSCLGAAVLGLYATGRVDSLSAVAQMVGSVHSHEPIPENVETYQQLFPIFLRLSRKLEDEWSAIAAFQHKQVDS